MKRYIIKLVDNAMPEPEYWLYGKTWGIDRSDATMFVSENAARQHCISMGWYKERKIMGAIEIEEFEAKCYRLGSFFGRCPAFNDYDLASDINAIFKEIKQ